MAFWQTPSEISELDRKTIDSGTPGLVLMERAGRAVANTVMQMTTQTDGTVVVYTGPGNNGGDGFVAARFLFQSGYNVVVRPSFGSSSTISDSCRVNMQNYLFAGGLISHEPQVTASVAVDALLGVGFTGNLRGGTLDLAVECSGLNIPVVSVDMPTGVDGLTGQCDHSSIKAEVTVTFAAPKLGLLLPPGCGHCGSLLLEDIGIHVPRNNLRRVMTKSFARGLLPERPVDSHKGVFGKVLVLAGSEKMPGAPQLAALGALRSGCGLVEVCVPLPASPATAGRIPEVLSTYFLPGDVTSLPDYNDFSVVLIGPGMGKTASTERILRHVLGTWKIPVVLDADALNVIDSTIAEMLKSYPGETVITPHPGELKRLTGCGDDLNARYAAADKTAKALNCSVLLKGKPSLVFSQDGHRTTIPTGNHGLATGGSGDILAGIVAGLMAQGSEGFDALSLAAYVHGLSADILAGKTSARSIIPTDVAGKLGSAFSMIEGSEFDSLLGGNPYWTRG
ncbi:MAG: NAD(P)H-hydrate dehydratase [Candidatus Fermentibacteria bacterium]|nr:NAD(P)H-hydrate dehydratase [Candidatus Fermentibacteria bacterium]